MVLLSNNHPLETRDLAGGLPAKARHLFVSTLGPPRTKLTRRLPFFSGGRLPVARYVRLQSKSVRIYFYDRAGYGSQSPTSVDQTTARNGYRGCSSLGFEAYRRWGELFSPGVQCAPSPLSGCLNQDIFYTYIDISPTPSQRPPYIVGGYRWGGVMARTILSLHPSSVAGLVLADPTRKLMYEVFQPSIPPPPFAAIGSGGARRLRH
jgi:pimeloyl-ACP methyl ester carboxylesterase